LEGNFANFSRRLQSENPIVAIPFGRRYRRPALNGVVSV
jgi:hypothetical protein